MNDTSSLPDLEEADPSSSDPPHEHEPRQILTRFIDFSQNQTLSSFNAVPGASNYHSPLQNYSLTLVRNENNNNSGSGNNNGD